MSRVTIQCPQCGASVEKDQGQVNRARKIGAPIYCGRKCAGLARRLANPPTRVEKRAAKAAYDRAYRAKNAAKLKARHAEYFQQTYDPEKAKIIRAARMPLHVEYCRQPKYKAWKREYDRRHRARKYFGEFAEVVLLEKELRQEVETQAQEAVNLEKAREKTNERKHRASEGTDGCEPEECSVGNAE